MSDWDGGASTGRCSLRAHIDADLFRLATTISGRDQRGRRAKEALLVPGGAWNHRARWQLVVRTGGYFQGLSGMRSRQR